METLQSIGFMVFGLGFFLFVAWIIFRQDTIDYDRKLNERREFGYFDQRRRTRKEERKELRKL